MANNDFIALDVTGIKELNAKLSTLPPAVQDAVTDGVSKYLIGVFRKYPPENHEPTRAQAYPEAIIVTRNGKVIRGYFSMAQWRYVRWLIASGQVPYTRRSGSQAMRNNWRQIDKGRNSIIANETTAAYYTMGDGSRARYSKLVGWRTMTEIIDSRLKQIERVAQDAANKALKKKGLQ